MAGRMDARFTESVMRDGKLYGLPVSLYTNGMGVNADTMEKLGLTQDDLPTTWLEFLDFAANFYYDYGEENADVALRYVDDDPASYPNIFDHARFAADAADQARLIEALRVLSTGENLETAVNADEVLRYFTVQVLVMNWDSYLGHTGHNYFLYEED